MESFNEFQRSFDAKAKSGLIGNDYFHGELLIILAQNHGFVNKKGNILLHSPA
jgi:hypothetical protein